MSTTEASGMTADGQGRPAIAIRNLTKTYASGLPALSGIDLDIYPGEIFALLGPNGAGKTTLINVICGIVNPSGGSVHADGHDIVADYRAARRRIGLVPQELTTDAFETVLGHRRRSAAACSASRPIPAHIEKTLKATCHCGTRRNNKHPSRCRAA